jgi:hypothetical protein
MVPLVTDLGYSVGLPMVQFTIPVLFGNVGGGTHCLRCFLMRK